MHGLDLYIQHVLTHLFPWPLDSQLTILFILQPFFGEHLIDAPYINDSKFPLLSPLSRLFYDRDSNRVSFLTEFFSDPSRSGPFYLDGDKYATFAINFINYLITEAYVCESVKYTFTSRSNLLVNVVHALRRPSSILLNKLNCTCFLCPFYCHRHHIR